VEQKEHWPFSQRREIPRKSQGENESAGGTEKAKAKERSLLETVHQRVEPESPVAVEEAHDLRRVACCASELDCSWRERS